MKSVILDKLQEIEREEDVRILFACESGSRAWGFESSDSDYDVRFLYVHPRDWYLQIDPGRDVIEQPINDLLDVCGWDLKKALLLYRKSNSSIFEWLRSPIIYLEQGDIAKRLRDSSDDYYSPLAVIHHYWSLARGNYKDFAQADTIRIKKLFYMLRHFLACQWMERGLGIVPMEFDQLMDRVVEDQDLKAQIRELVEIKKQGVEQGPINPPACVREFIEDQYQHFSKITIELPSRRGETDQLNQVFLSALDEQMRDLS